MILNLPESRIVDCGATGVSEERMTTALDVLSEPKPSGRFESRTAAKAVAGPSLLRRWLDFAGGFGLAGRTTFWTIVLGTVMSGTISYLMYQAGVTALIATQLGALELSVRTASLRFTARIDFALRQTELIERLPATARAVADPRAQGADPSGAAWRDRLTETLEAMLSTWPEYYQARLISLAGDGQEIIRVERNRGGVVQNMPPADLQEKGDRPYFKAIAALGRGQVYVSAIDLNQERGQIAMPFQPTVRTGTLVFDDAGRAQAMIVLNIDVSQFFGAIREAIGPGDLIYVTNSDGDYLSAPDPLKTFGFDFGRGDRLQDDVPELAPLYAGDKRSFNGAVRLGDRQFYAHAMRVDFDPNQVDRNIVIAAMLPADAVLAGAREQANYVLLVALGFILAGVVFAIVMARAVARPIQRMTVAAGQIASGRRDVEIGDLKRRRDETGALARSLDAMLREIAEREDKLVAQSRELTRSNQELAQFAYIASHDLQEPLRMIGSYLDLLKRRYDGQLDDEAQEFIAFAVDGAARMKRLINDLLGYSRAGNNPLTLETLDARAVVDAVLRTLAGPIAELGAEVDVGELPQIKADVGQVERLFVNLIENALKYRAEAPPRIRISARPAGRMWEFAVADNGIGIDPRFKDKVFEIFKRLHARDRFSGTGIGLSVCKMVVERHGGQIRVEPNPGGGSVFIFTLPEQDSPA